jgi:hypothetical protein
MGIGGSPSEKIGIEILGGGLVGGGQFEPAERGNRVFVDVGHGRKYITEARCWLLAASPTFAVADMFRLFCNEFYC